MQRKTRNPAEKSNLPARVRTALEDREFGCNDLVSILRDAGENDVAVLRPFLSDLLVHHEWIVRAEALEFVGRFHLRRFLDAVKARLGDKNHVVREYALCAYYDLLRKKALPVIEEACQDKDVSYRVTGLVLRYVESGNEALLDQLRRILTRKRCRRNHCYTAMNTFDAYVDAGLHPEIIELFEKVQSRLAEAPRASGLDKDLPKMLDKWKRSTRRKTKGE